ncbi:MAG TPA: hypothetical protein VMW72_10700 [Sedimentisphaerales bacterium]|nr:hypothetical protein [Sedimentisphaerales bacterium]
MSDGLDMACSMFQSKVDEHPSEECQQQPDSDCDQNHQSDAACTCAEMGAVVQPGKEHDVDADGKEDQCQRS